MPTQQIVFGGMDTESKEFFMILVPSRNKEALGIHIEKYIKEKTFNHGNMFGSYIHYFAENRIKYRYDFVNNSTNFIDPVISTPIQNIENLWLQLKKYKRKKGYSKSR
ncbi:hypothetical protein H312_01545 [Anncaliia algerae PRA339]|uniref:ISXO2-like transposase domain-containing protein n=1 Tax=Anncaliia algerae PRA339 TaxID=1288291 RepID=A0A059F263_9MICR|nr:hypothetical protein H312_01545 [Anncaliia algerae PRA339]